jgi:hypothetical protein
MVSTWQMMLLATIMSILVSLLVSINTWYLQWTMLPVVRQDASGQCVKVDNYSNGQAYNCNDIGVLLRQYRKAPAE